MNSVVNPVLLRRGLAGRGRSEIATLEHVGRRSGTKRLTPVHPEATPDGFRIVVPRGVQSEWARNVVAAGHCRIQLHDQVFDLDEPTVVDAMQATNLPWLVQRVMAALGFKYLNLRTLAAHPASLAAIGTAWFDVDWSGAIGASAGSHASVAWVMAAGLAPLRRASACRAGRRFPQPERSRRIA